jgi:hypothetical protein
MDHELERIRKEAVTAQFKAISRHFPRGTEENHEKPRQWTETSGQFHAPAALAGTHWSGDWMSHRACLYTTTPPLRDPARSLVTDSSPFM